MSTSEFFKLKKFVPLKGHYRTVVIHSPIALNKAEVVQYSGVERGHDKSRALRFQQTDLQLKKLKARDKSNGLTFL